MKTWLSLIAILHSPPLPMHHSGAFYQRPTVNWYADAYLLPRWFATNLTQAESSFRTGLETRRIIYIPTMSHRDRLKFMAKYPGSRWDHKHQNALSVVLSHGLLQPNPRFELEFAAAVGLRHFNWRDPDQSARVGLGRLAWLVKRYGKWGACICYNGGEAWYRALQHGIRPLAETCEYIRRVL